MRQFWMMFLCLLSQTIYKNKNEQTGRKKMYL